MEQWRESLRRQTSQQGGVSILPFAEDKLHLESGWEKQHSPRARRPLATQLLGLCCGPMVEKGACPWMKQPPCPIFLEEGLGTRYHSNSKQGLICFVDE